MRAHYLVTTCVCGSPKQGGIRYAVTVQEAVLVKGRKTMARPKSVILPLEEDGWPTIEVISEKSLNSTLLCRSGMDPCLRPLQEAQNAVATRALFLATPEEDGLWQYVVPPYQEMWFDWVDQDEARDR